MAKIPADLRRYLLQSSDPSLRRASKSYREQLVDEIIRLTTAQRKNGAALDVAVERKLRYRVDGTLTAKSEREVRRVLEASVDRSLEELARRMSLTVQRGTKASATAMARFLEKKGVDAPSKSAVDRIAREVAQEDKRFYGLSTKQRVTAVGRNHIRRVVGIIQEASNEDEALEKIRVSSVTPIGGGRARNGSVSKDMGRLLVSEGARKGVEASRRVAKEAGVIFVYRRLSPAHIFRSSIEVCEDLNSSVQPGIRKALIQAGIDPDGVDLEGLYEIDDIPEYPHPSCACFLEPLIGEESSA